MKWNKQDANDIGNSSSALVCSFETDKFNFEQRLAVFHENTHAVRVMESSYAHFEF